MTSKNIQDHQSIFKSTSRRDFVTQHNFFTIVVSAGIKEELAGLFASAFAEYCRRCRSTTARCKDGPSGKTSRHLLHILLCISTVNAERMKLHQLARIVL